MTTATPIRAEGLMKRFGELQAVRGVNVTVEAGTCLGLLGHNDAGKTTTIEMLEGLQRPDSGSVTLFGLDWTHDATRIRERIGVQLQESELPERLKVHETLRLFASFYASCSGKGGEVDAMLTTVGLQDKRTAFVGDLSGGQRQRLSLACALVHEPDLLFLDEPTTGLDPQGRRLLWEIVETFKSRGGTVLLTTHFMEEAERLADRLLILDQGSELRAGTPAAILEEHDEDTVLEMVFPEADGREELPAALVDALSKTPGCGPLKVDGRRVRLAVSDVQKSLTAVLATAAHHRLTIDDLSVHRPTLDDVFVSLTGRGLTENASADA